MLLSGTNLASRALGEAEPDIQFPRACGRCCTIAEQASGHNPGRLRCEHEGGRVTMVKSMASSGGEVFLRPAATGGPPMQDCTLSCRSQCSYPASLQGF